MTPRRDRAAAVPGTADDLRELIRDAHAAAKDLRAAIREARGLASELTASVRGAYVAEHGAAMQHVQDELNRVAVQLNEAAREAQGNIIRAMTPVKLVPAENGAGLDVVFAGQPFEEDAELIVRHG